MMAEKIKCENLDCLKRSVKRGEIHHQEVEAGPYFVAKIDRYITDRQHTGHTGLDNDPVIDVHQVTLSDSHHKLKAILNVSLSQRIQKAELQEGCEVIIKKCSLRVDETELAGNSLLIVHELDVLKQPKDVEKTDLDLSSLPWCNDSDDKEKEDVPLSSSRGYFLNQWSSFEMEGAIWKRQGEVKTTPISFTQQDIYSVVDIAKKWNDIRTINPPLIVQVINRCRLLHYAKPNKSDKWPLQAHFSVCDNTGVCNMVLWNAMCPAYYYRLSEGAILLIRKFTVKRSFYNGHKSPHLVHNLQSFDVDININSHHPLSEITILSPTAVPWNLSLPHLQYNFITRNQQGSLPNDYVCDITGCVTYIGRYEREGVAIKHGEDSGGFWVLRWLHLLDNSSRKPFIVQMFRVAEKDVAEEIRPGSVIVCRHMRIVNNVDLITDSNIRRESYLTSTMHTKVHVIDGNTSLSIRSQQEVKNVIGWSKSQQCQESVQYSKHGGYFSHPIQLPSTITELKQIYEDFKITSSDDWSKVIGGMYYKEHKRLFLQAVMVAAKLITPRSNRHDSSPVRKSPRKNQSQRTADQSSPQRATDNSANNEVIVDPDQYQNYAIRLGEPAPDGYLHSAFPIQYRSENWSTLQQWLSFDASKFSQDHHKQLMSDQDSPVHFIITWTGLNSQVLLNTLWKPRLEPSDASQTMENLLCKGNNSGFLFTTDLGASKDNWSSLMKTVKECAGQRFLLVVDSYKSYDQVEIVLNTAYKVS